MTITGPMRWSEDTFDDALARVQAARTNLVAALEDDTTDFTAPFCVKLLDDALDGFVRSRVDHHSAA